VLFPAIRRALQDQQSDSRLDLESLLKEHREECWLIEQTQIALFTGESSNFMEGARKLIEVVSEHIIKEERMLFPLIEQLLTEPQTVALGVRIREANADFGRMPYNASNGHAQASGTSVPD
jgi:iron-sulfur cluster repair protein YtfE (RIC family)